MSSKHKKSSQSRHDNHYPTRWSEWAWNEQYQCDTRYREVSEGNWEWDYGEPTAVDTPGEAQYSQSVEDTQYTPRDKRVYPPASLPPVDEDAPLEPSDGNYRHDGGVSDLGHRMAETSIQSSSDSHQYPAENQYLAEQEYTATQQYPAEHQYSEDYQNAEGKEYEDYRQVHGDKRRGKGSSQPQDHRRRDKKKGTSSKARDNNSEYQSWASEEYQGQQIGDPSQNDDRESHQQAGYPASLNHVYEAVPERKIGKANTTNTKRDGEKLDKDFVIHNSREFYFGRVFKVLWSEPVGTGGTEITTLQAAYGERAHSKVRRFLIVSERNKGHSICIPILTYGNQGVLKRGVHPEDHAVVYSSRKDGPYCLEREKGLMTKHPIRIEVVKDSHKLDPLSRLNYAKLYTVEHNVKVLFIGKVARSYERDVKHGYMQAHPPFTEAGPGFHQGSHEDLTRGAEGNDPYYPSTAELTQDRGGTSTYQDFSTYPPNPNYTTPAHTNPTFPTSSMFPPDSSYPAYDDGYTGD